MTWGGPGPQRAKFISSTNVDSNGCNEDEAAAHARSSTNAAIRHAFKLLRSEAARVDGQLLNDFQSLMEGECIYLPGFFGGGHADLSVMQGLTNDLQNFGREVCVYVVSVAIKILPFQEGTLSKFTAACAKSRYQN